MKIRLELLEAALANMPARIKAASGVESALGQFGWSALINNVQSLRDFFPYDETIRRICAEHDANEVVIIVDWKMPRQYAIVRYEGPTEGYAAMDFVYLGEIPNMPGHCVVLGFSPPFSGQTIVGLHTSDFRELTEEEL